jgi:hypothetical protein
VLSIMNAKPFGREGRNDGESTALESGGLHGRPGRDRPRRRSRVWPTWRAAGQFGNDRISPTAAILDRKLEALVAAAFE